MENYNEKVLKLRVREKELTEQLEYWEQYPPANNMGKWARQTKLDSLKEKLKKVQEKIEFHDTVYLSNEIYKEWQKTAE
jgi:ppGpp synthetase/RelA/SpoT-type nucleotidyltranferase